MQASWLDSHNDEIS